MNACQSLLACIVAGVACCVLQHCIPALTVMLPRRLNYPGMYSYEAE